ncbi:MAG: tetratricopeptide repeat protein [Okeania sp. SIO3B5]|uniref:tetratricopeptide repeat protein n=1 Tax=Okeania sp. SIO3B5 TaxID=2607811 RepID=UPI0013FF1B37|nr:tetratricopeptide repeat protein [Okeania sp. SIO3B5]NEO53169.1 tetratricopeptide repeat protein [Okeania sp. SIO3B5]
MEEGITWFKDKGSSTTTMAVEANDNQQAMKTQQPNVFLGLGNTQCEQGDFAGALPYFQKALTLNLQQSLDIYINFGDSFSQCGRFSEAIAAYQEAIALESDNPHIYIHT